MGFYDFKYEQSGNALKLTSDYLKDKQVVLIHDSKKYEAKILKITQKAILFSFENKDKWVAKTSIEIKAELEDNKIILLNTYK